MTIDQDDLNAIAQVMAQVLYRAKTVRFVSAAGNDGDGLSPFTAKTDPADAVPGADEATIIFAGDYDMGSSVIETGVGSILLGAGMEQTRITSSNTGSAIVCPGDYSHVGHLRVYAARDGEFRSLFGFKGAQTPGDNVTISHVHGYGDTDAFHLSNGFGNPGKGSYRIYDSIFESRFDVVAIVRGLFSTGWNPRIVLSNTRYIVQGPASTGAEIHGFNTEIGSLIDINGLIECSNSGNTSSTVGGMAGGVSTVRLSGTDVLVGNTGSGGAVSLRQQDTATLTIGGVNYDQTSSVGTISAVPTHRIGSMTPDADEESELLLSIRNSASGNGEILSTQVVPGLAAVAAQTNQLEFTADGVIADAGSTGAGGTPNVIITPLMAAVSNPRYSSRNLATIAAGTAPTDIITITDGAGAALDLSGKSLRLVAYTRADEADEYDPENDDDDWDETLTPAFKYETGSSGNLSVGGASGNQVTIEHEAQEAGRYRYWLLNTTDNIAISKGRMPIEPSVLDV